MAVVAAGLAACGGGGGGSDPPPVAATLALSPSAVTFDSRYEDDQHPDSRSIGIQTTGDEIVAVNASVVTGEPDAPWLTMSVSGGGHAYTLALAVGVPAPIGDNKVSLTIQGMRADRSVATQQTATVDYAVLARLAASEKALSFENTNGATPASLETVNVSGDGLQWTATATQPWIHVENGEGTGRGSFGVRVDDDGLAAGNHADKVTVRSSDGQSVDIAVAYDLNVATLKASTSLLDFGGTNGRDLSARSLQLLLNTGSNAYPWALTAIPEWLSADVAAGDVSGAPQKLTLTPDFTKASAGTSTGTLEFQAMVNGDTLKQTVDVRLDLDEHRLYPLEEGVAFSSTPAWSRLTRSISIVDNFGRKTPWTAVSNQPWLTVTPSGIAGDSLVLTAAGNSTPLDETSYATVTISSSDPSVVGRREVIVGLWRGSSRAVSLQKPLSKPYTTIRNDPIRPWIFVHRGEEDIDIYNVYTGTLVRTLAHIGNALGAMAVSGNGDELYVADVGDKRIAVVDLRTFAKVRTIPTVRPATGIAFIAARTSGVEIIYAGDGAAYRGGDGKLLSSSTGIHGFVAANRSGSRVFDINSGISPYEAKNASVDYTSGGGGKLLVAVGNKSASDGSNGQDVAVKSDGSIVYLASGSPYAFQKVNGRDMSTIGFLPGGDAYPNNIEVGSDDRVMGGISGGDSESDIWLYRADGSLESGYKVVGYAQELLPRQLVFSGDALIAATLTSDPKLVFIPLGP